MEFEKRVTVMLEFQDVSVFNFYSEYKIT